MGSKASGRLEEVTPGYGVVSGIDIEWHRTVR